MQIPSTAPVVQVAVPTGAGVTARVVSGNLATIPMGALLEAVVTSASPREATLTVAGQALTVRPPFALPQGATILVRVPPSAANATIPLLELSVPGNASPTQRAGATESTQTGATKADATPLPSRLPTRPAVVDVLSALPDGRIRVSIEGQEQIATSAQQLAPGGRYVMQVERTPTGIALKPPPDSPKLSTEVATAVLRTSAPTLGEAIKPLQAELATLSSPKPQPVPVATRNAATAVSNVLRTIVPGEPRPLKAPELQQLIENGGLHYEAKLARIAAPDEAKPAAEPRDTANTEAKDAAKATERTEAPATPRSVREMAPDLKGDLLRLLQTVQDLGGAARAPAAQAALSGIESQQAANALAQQNGTPYFLQVPFPDGDEWRTMQLSLEPQNLPDQPDAERAGRFRMFMHVPLSELGETWIDAGLSGDRFRATIYLDRGAVRDRVRTALPELQAELEGSGFSEVLLDVRPSSELPDYRRRDSSSLQAGRPASVSVLDVKV
jgi:hypothetical protein